MGLSGAYYSDRIKIKKRKIADVKGVYGPRPITAPAPAASGGEGSIEGFGGCPSVPTGAYTAGKYAGNRKTRGL